MQRGSVIRLGRSVLLLAVALSAAPAAASFVTFESGQVRPLALSPDGSQLFAANTPDDRLEIFSVGSDGLTHTGSVPVGLEPVAVAARTNGEVWVVNQLSDSVSIVDVASATPHVVRTLLVGDEPRDVVFAGPKDGNNFFLRAFITTAHRGQNSGVPFTDLITPGIGRADVWVFQATSVGGVPGASQLAVVNLFGDTPRALAVSPNGNTVYAAVFQSGNRTTAVTEGVVCDDPSGAANNTVAGPCSVSSVSYPGGLPNPDTAGGTKGPETGLVVKFNPASGHNHWEDTLGRNWDNAVRFSLPDDDVFRIDATANPPAPLPSATGVKPGQPFAGVGTVLFDMAVNPLSGKVYVTNGEANNLTRFEGPGGGGSTVRGHLHEARITVLDPASGSVTPRHLNKHIVYSVVQDSPNPTSLASLATPLGMAVTSNGATLYVSAFGSGVVGIFNVTQLESNNFTPSQSDHIALSGGGPSGLVLDETHGRLYVLTRFNNSVSVIDTAMRKEVTHLPLYNPEPASVKNGRPVLYDAVATSSNGEAACASCHIFADFDSLAWDLGNPDGSVLQNCNPFRVGPFGSAAFHPLKGPMTTQSLRGMANAGPMHWRGDRNGKTNQQTGAWLLRHRRLLELRERDPARQGPAPAQPLPEGRHVRHAGDPVHQCRYQRDAGGVHHSAAAGARLRLPARWQRRHALPLPQRHRVQRRLQLAVEPRPGPPPGRAVHARFPDQPGPHRRPADHARQRRRGGRARRSPHPARDGGRVRPGRQGRAEQRATRLAARQGDRQVPERPHR